MSEFGISIRATPHPRTQRICTRSRWRLASLNRVAFLSIVCMGAPSAFAQFLRQDGTTPLTADWTAGNFKIDSQNSTRWFNVLAYGAVGNGSADDTLAIQAALNAAASVSGLVVLPAGPRPGSGEPFAFRTTAALTVPPGVSLLGDGVLGQGNTARLLADHTGTAISISNASVTNQYSRVYNLDLRRGSATPARLIYINNAWFVYIDQCYFLGASAEIVKVDGNSAHINISNSLFQGGPPISINVVGSSCHDQIYSGNEIGGTANGIVIASRNSTVFLYANVIEGAGGAGIRVEGSTFSAAEQNLLYVHGGYFENNTGYDIDLNPSGQIGFVGAYIYGGFFYGSGVTTGAIRMNSTVKNLTVLGINTAAHTGAAIYLGSSPITNAKIVITGNSFGEATKIAATPSISGSEYFGQTGQSATYDIGTATGTRPVILTGAALAGPGLQINNDHSSSNNARIFFSSRGVDKWAIGADQPGSGTQTLHIVDAINGKDCIWIAGDADGGKIGFSNVTSPLASVDVSGGEVRYKVGTGIASASVISPQVSAGNILHVTGSTTINRITGRFSGDWLVLIADGNWSLGSGDNIRAVSGARAVNDAVYLVYDGATWYQIRS